MISVQGVVLVLLLYEFRSAFKAVGGGLCYRNYHSSRLNFSSDKNIPGIYRTWNNLILDQYITEKTGFMQILA